MHSTAEESASRPSRAQCTLRPGLERGSQARKCLVHAYAAHRRLARRDSDHSDSATRPCRHPAMALKPLGWLDKLLALWIILAMALGLLLGVFVPSAQQVLNQTKFVNVSRGATADATSEGVRSLCRSR